MSSQAFTPGATRYTTVSDHSGHLTTTCGSDGKRLATRMGEIDRLNTETENFTALKSIEVNILEAADVINACDPTAPRKLRRRV